MTLRKIFCLAVALSCSALLASAQAAGPACTNQSPRPLYPQTKPPYDDLSSTTSIVVSDSNNSVIYRRRGGTTEQVLYRCGQHYHFPIETPQGCDGELSGRVAPGTRPLPGQWVEFHTVYAAGVKQGDCNPEKTDCCETPPFLVRAFSAKVIEGSRAVSPIVTPAGRPLAEWTGSTTGPDKVENECKPEAQWSFRLGCGYTVSLAQLRTFCIIEEPRNIQTGDRLSRDLTLVRQGKGRRGRR